MRKLGILLCIVLFLLHCGPKQGIVDTGIEDGVEVVFNHLEPYLDSDVPSNLSLYEVFSIDTEDDSIAAKGITDVYLFDVDANGNIYIMRPPTGKGDLVFVFSREGELKSTFGKFGQGPFELEYPSDIFVTPRNEIWILESPKYKYHVFDTNGVGVYERTLDFSFETIEPLPNENFLLKQLIVDNPSEAKYFSIAFSILDEEFLELQELDRFSHVPNRRLASTLQEKIVNGIEYIFLSGVHEDRILIANSDREYEILEYDLEGKLLRKVRKDYTPVPVSASYKTEYVRQYEEFMPEYAKKIYFPESWHPFHSFFLDEVGRIYVMTYEPGENPGEYIYDVFNEDGVFILRTSLNILHQNYGRLYAKATGGRLHCIQEKQSGFKKLVIFDMIWQ